MSDSERRIVGFRQDLDQEWIADLECGHSRHIPHDPPWQVFPWILHHEGRAAHIGTRLSCRKCDETSQQRPRDRDWP